MHEDAARQREHLCFILKPAKGRREHKAVVVAPEVGAFSSRLVFMKVLKSEAFVANKSWPFHKVGGDVSYIKKEGVNVCGVTPSDMRL